MTEPPLFPDEQVATADERSVLATFLDYYRTEVVRKARGVSEQDARRRLVPSLTTIGGLVKHLTVVEESWFLRRMGARDDLPPRMPTEQEFTLSDDDTVESLIAAYEKQCALSREVASAHELDDNVPHHRLGRVSLRWIYVHMIEETARHAGHLDILREQIDGETG
ncbi:DinB family protein [Labedaea rhizosphaerae]|uniref:Uncharacterized protein DUF664 n=1 Tax=Labedaea rhizosphaerae TaxID=598644 RepID=A0A4R6S270_LABRH|nr:DinB family protein [Labedaea rhizosphaerae]TDP93650.1 uncharacterized protein DUF664 [Labedaea rhizosphaerae]